MNLFFRLILMLVAALRAPAFGIAGISRLKFRVWWSDMGSDGLISHTRYLSFADLGVSDYTIRTGILNVLRANSWAPIVVSKEFRYMKHLGRGDRIEFTTRLTGWREEYCCLYHEVIRGGEIVAEGHTIARFIGAPKQRHPLALEVAQLAGFPVDTSPPVPARVLAIMDRLVSEKQSRKRRKGEVASVGEG